MVLARLVGIPVTSLITAYVQLDSLRRLAESSRIAVSQFSHGKGNEESMVLGMQDFPNTVSGCRWRPAEGQAEAKHGNANWHMSWRTHGVARKASGVDQPELLHGKSR